MIIDLSIDFPRVKYYTSHSAEGGKQRQIKAWCQPSKNIQSGQGDRHN